MLLALVLAMTLQPEPSKLVTLSREMMSRIDSSRQAVARTEAEWALLWKQHAGDSALPAVDFGTRSVVAVFLGSRPSAGYSVEITGARQHGGALIVAWRERRPDPGDVTAQVMTSPAHIVSIPRFAGEIRFEQAAK